MRPRRARTRFPVALAASAALHALVLAALWVSVSRASPPPRVRSIRVDIVSLAPNQAGEPPAEPPAAATTAPEPEPEAARPPEAPPEAPEPEPLPPEKAAPAPAPAPKREPPKPEPRPKPPAREADRTAKRPQETAKEAAPRTSDARSARNTAPATGREPDATSAGGEGVRIRTPGVDCPVEAYCNNIPRQVRRYFRRPANSRADRGNVCFRILPDGSADANTIDVRNLRGSIAFKLALMEAVEKAGQQRAFGALPREFGGSFTACVEMAPEGS